MLLKNEKVRNNIRLAYMCFIMVYMAVREVTPLQFLIDNILVSAAVFAVGFALILWDLLTDRRCLSGKGIDLLVLFLVICGVSSLLNIKYGIGGNVKAIGALVLQYFLFFACGTGRSDEDKKRELTALSRTICIVWGLFAAISIHMYVFNVEYVVIGGSWGIATQGFSTEYQRLWGIFQDPNYASFISIATIFASIYLMMARKKVVSYILGALSIVVQLSYIVLAGSRAARIFLLASSLLLGVYWFVTTSGKNIKKILLGAVATVLCFVVTVAAFTAFKYALPMYKNALRDMTSDGVQYVAEAYDYFYKVGQVPMYGEQVTPNDPEDPDDPDEPGAGIIDRTDLDKEDPSNGRFKRWKHTVQIFLKSPIYGTSPRNVAAFAEEHAPDTLMALYGIAPHNGYLDVLVGTGALGMLTLLSFLVWMVVIIVKKMFRSPRNLIFAFSAATVFVFAGAAALISDVYMVFTLGSVFFWTLMGYAVNEEKNERESLILKLFNSIFCKKKA